jgi:two-component system, NarL family, sensor histidine kinase DegS
MTRNPEQEAQSKLSRFSRLGTWYMLALSIVATVAIVGQILIQRHLESQLTDARTVNVAGKQRMLSQRITKVVLLIKDDQSIDDRRKIIDELQLSVPLWKVSQEGLQHGNDSLGLLGDNSVAIHRLFNNVSSHFKSMHASADVILKSLQGDAMRPYRSLEAEVNNILSHEELFLSGMESIVLQYANEAHEKVATLSTLEYILLAISIFVIALEVIFVFRPTAQQVSTTVAQLAESEKSSRKLAKEVMTLYASLEKSYEQISHINKPIENPRLIAKSDKGGNVIFVAPSFSEITGVETRPSQLQFQHLFDGLKHPEDWMDEVIDTVSNERFWQGEVSFRDKKGDEVWMEVEIVPTYDAAGEVFELLLMGSDITLRKTAEQNFDKKTRAEIEKRINAQKFRSVLILEGQEEERKRIAMDIHDGIGQMLSSLKFQIESIDLQNHSKAAEKMEEIKLLTKQVIKEVRKVTFNLKPTVLGDYGLQAALKVFTKEIGKLIDIKLSFHTEGELPRISQKMENNIFRIVQEAINNAIKYSEAEAVEIGLEQKEGEIVITVKDEGKGFDEKILESRNANIESGRGFFNMYERTEYINGNLEINSKPGKGTEVVLRVPVNNLVEVG